LDADVTGMEDDMRKSLLGAVLLSMALVLGACSGEADVQEGSDAGSAVSEQTQEVTDASTDDAAAGEDAAEDEGTGGVEVDEGLLTTEITVPAEYFADEEGNPAMTQEELDAGAADGTYESATLNDDGSVTYVMTKAQHQQMLDDMAAGIDEALATIPGSEDYPCVTAVSHNDDFTTFTVTTTNAEPDMNESFSMYVYWFYGAYYNSLVGDADANITVEFVNADSGEVIGSYDSADA